MRLLLNSKYLFKKMKEIKFASDYVERVELDGSLLKFITTEKTVELQVEVIRFTERKIEQAGRRWDDIRDVVSVCEEQPIVLEIYPNVANLIFQV